MKHSRAKIIYTVSVFIALAAFDNIIIGLFPPLFSSIAKDLKVNVSSLGFVSAVNILVTAISSMFWGFLAGKYKRKKLIIFGTVIWSVSVFFTSRSVSYFQLFISQIATGVGLGCIASIGFSVVTDFIPKKSRGMLLSLWGMSQGFGGIAGALMASLIATASSWRKPFEIVSLIGLLLTFLYLFIKEPTMGSSEPELKELIKDGYEYSFNIEFSHLHEITLMKSNILLFIQGFFMNITTGSLIWLPTLYISKIQSLGYNSKTAIVAAGYLYGMFQFGGLTSAFFGHMGDRFQRRNLRGRAYFTSLFTLITMPLYIIMFIIPMSNLQLPGSNSFSILLDLIKQIVLNPWISLMFIMSFLASAAQSANTPNWLALITDVNLPEHRGTAFSIGNLANSLGRTVGNVGIGVVLTIASIYNGEPNNYIITLALFQLFLIPSALCYYKMAKANVKDINKVKMTLSERAKTSLERVE